LDIRVFWGIGDIGIVSICTLDIRVFAISLLQSTDGDGTFISLMAQEFQQDYEYDAFGRLASIQGGADIPVCQTDYQYDEFGRVTQRETSNPSNNY